MSHHQHYYAEAKIYTGKLTHLQRLLQLGYTIKTLRLRNWPSKIKRLKLNSSHASTGQQTNDQ